MSNNLRLIGSVSAAMKFIIYYIMLLKFTLLFNSPVEPVASL